MLVGFKQNGTIEDGVVGSNPVFFELPGGRMKLQRSTPFHPPILVEIHDQIQPPVQPLGFVIIEIHMRVQILTMQVFVRAAAIERWVEEEVGDAGDLAHEVEKRSGLDQFVKFAVSRSDLADARIDSLAPHTAVDLVLRQRRTKRGEIGQ